MTPMTFGHDLVLGAAEHIRFQLYRQRISAPQVAALLGRDVRTIRKHLRGDTPWSLEELWTLSEALDVPFHVLTGLEVAS